jgi:hypothetical protein
MKQAIYIFVGLLLIPFAPILISPDMRAEMDRFREDFHKRLNARIC